MKQKLFKILGLLAVFLFLGKMPILSQTISYKLQHDSEFSIIRNFKNGVDITYSAMLDNTCFNYIDRNTGRGYCAPITEPFIVTDFEILDDTVYFCGCIYGASQACYGYFDINDVFFNGDPIYYIPTAPSSGGNVQLSGFNKIDVSATSWDEIHLVMTGFAYETLPDKEKDVTLVRSLGAIYEVLINSLGMHSAMFFVDTSYNFIYDDVAIVDNYAVISAHTPGNPDNFTSGYTVFYYNAPTSAGRFYLDSWLPSGDAPYQYAPPSMLPLPGGNVVHITKTTQDGFATVCKKRYSVGNDSLVISIYNSPVNFPIYRYVLPYNDGCREIVHNSLYDILYIVPGRDNTFYQIKTPYVSTTEYSPINLSYRLNSVDNADANMCEIFSGYLTSNSQKTLLRFDYNGYATCLQAKTLSNTALGIRDERDIQTQSISRETLSPGRFLPVISIFNYSTSCISNN